MKQKTQGAVRGTAQGKFFPLALVGTLFLLLSGTSCTTTGSSSSGSSGAGMPAYNPGNPLVRSRNALIAQEQPGNYYIGRRWWTDGTRFWGYLRKPGEPWINAKLVIMNESVKLQPDRLPEDGTARRHGFDHNYEYRIYGSFTGNVIYDPNSNFEVPEFRLTGYELINANPGFLFMPGEAYSPNRLPPKHPPVRR